MESIYIKGVKVSVCDLNTSVEMAMELAASGTPSYICVTDAGNIVNSFRNSAELKDAINNSAISLPDGRPISMLASMKGINKMERVTGAEFMIAVLEKTASSNMSHYFLGDTEEILTKLTDSVKNRYGVNVAGAHSPPFGDLNESVSNEIIQKINIANPDFIWVSLGGGKQEIWMNRHYNSINKGVMTGVGAAFRFLTGDIRRAPMFMQRSGLEWFYRMLQQPGKMAGRYARTLPYFAVYFLQEMFGKNLKSN